VERARALSDRIATALGAASEEGAAAADPAHLERLLGLNDKLTALAGNARGFMPPPRILLPSQIAFSAPAPPVITAPQSGHLSTPRRRHQHSTSLEISSPNFSIGDSDAESDAEELDATTLAPSLTRGILAQSMDKMRADRRAAAKRPAQPSLSVVTNGDKGKPDEEAAAAKSPDPEEVKNAERLVEAELAGGLLSSPVEHASRRWVEEEAEIFRRGTRLGVVDSDSEDDDGKKKASAPGLSPGLQGDTSALTGEELRKEIMNTEVPRSPPRSVAELNADESDDSKDDDARGD
jgi:hypothetical protein